NGSHDAHYFAHPSEMISGALPCPQISQINQRLVRRHIQAVLIQTFFHAYMKDLGDIKLRQNGYLAEALGTAKSFFTTSDYSSFVGFEGWCKELLTHNTPHLTKLITAWLPDLVNNGLMSESAKRDFVCDVAYNFISDLRRAGEQLFPGQASKDFDRNNQQFSQNAEEHMLLDFLFDHGFLPSYAFPREVRSFVIEEWKHGSNNIWHIGIKQRPQQSVDIALSEY